MEDVAGPVRCCVARSRRRCRAKTASPRRSGGSSPVSWRTCASPACSTSTSASETLMFDELRAFCDRGDHGGFLPAVKQIANVACLPGIVQKSIGGCGRALRLRVRHRERRRVRHVRPDRGGVPRGGGFRHKLRRARHPHQPRGEGRGGWRGTTGAVALRPHPVGVGSQGIIPTSPKGMEAALEFGMDWSLREGYAWAEDKEHCEEYGRMLNADPNKVSARAKKRGLPQMGTLGAGNHYAEIRVVDKDPWRRRRRQDGHRPHRADYGDDPLRVPGSGAPGGDGRVDDDGARHGARRHRCPATASWRARRIDSPEGKDYLAAMSCAANYAWVNRSSMTFLVRQAFSKMFDAPDDLDMHVVYDVSHNIAKTEEGISWTGSARRCSCTARGARARVSAAPPLIRWTTSTSGSRF